MGLCHGSQFANNKAVVARAYISCRFLADRIDPTDA